MEDRAMTMNVEARGDSGITLTDEGLPSLPLYVSRVREFGEQTELDAMFEAVERELRSQQQASVSRLSVLSLFG
jgi:hypothetical protein